MRVNQTMGVAVRELMEHKGLSGVNRNQGRRLDDLRSAFDFQFSTPTSEKVQLQSTVVFRAWRTLQTRLRGQGECHNRCQAFQKGRQAI